MIALCLLTTCRSIGKAGQSPYMGYSGEILKLLFEFMGKQKADKVQKRRKYLCLGSAAIFFL